MRRLKGEACAVPHCRGEHTVAARVTAGLDERDRTGPRVSGPKYAAEGVGTCWRERESRKGEP